MKWWWRWRIRRAEAKLYRLERTLHLKREFLYKGSYGHSGEIAQYELGIRHTRYKLARLRDRLYPPPVARLVTPAPRPMTLREELESKNRG